ncbi:5'-nucleotidase C-terminal domain-containing protein [Oceanobacter mangrovi]|uniref:5'-nucleotidase C-terminal domain-containing protein n=1 Tax=Oceanobacter mangrovi TaxID=2862510 RepID=UPI001FE57E1B|nr:5'-nucleotidase C-terminal domain-containing protein [Oceanobacter mangrovi]
MKAFKLSALSLAVLLAACGSDGDNGADGTNGSNGSNALVSQQTLAVGSSECANGGTLVSTGIDSDGDGVLASTEVSSTEAICNGGDASKAIDLTILHMNDHHSHLAADDFGFDVSGLGLDSSVTEVDVTYGGFPMMVSLFDTLKGQNNNVLKLHAGDAVTGTIYYTLFNGVADAEMMNQICFDAFALGNHEFDGGDAGLAQFLDALNSSACNTPALAANVTPGASSALASGYLKPYTTFEFEGETVGVIGIDIASKTKESSFPDADTLFADETTTAQQYIDELEGMGVNKIILMTHYQYTNDLVLAGDLTGVDVIVGGDSHTLLGSSTFTDLGVGNPVAEYPTVTTNADGETVCVVQAWEYAHIMGKLNVSFDEDGVVTSCGGHPYLPISTAYDAGEELSSSDTFKITQALTAHDEVVAVTADATATAMLAVYDEEADVLRQTVIGTAAEDMCFERIPGQGRSSICDVSATYLHGSDITGQVAKGFVTVTPTADIAIQNGGGVRVDLSAGDVTFADAYELMPFSNTLVTLEMTGAEIVAVLEEALDNALTPDGSTGSYPYAYGLRFDVDASQSEGSRLSNIEINSRMAGDWTALDTSASYIVVTNNYIAAGQDGYDTFGTITGEKYVDTYTEYAQSFADYMQILTDAGESLEKLPTSEYSTQSFIDTDGCAHTTNPTTDGCTFAAD